MDACEILHAASECIGDRAKDRDLPDGERTMRRIVGTFEQLTSIRITETQGWLFMAIVKLARATAGRHRLDDFIDGASYMALAGECADRLSNTPRAVHAAIAEIRLAAAELDE